MARWIPNPRHLDHRLKKLKRLQRAVSRKQKGSHNRKKGRSAARRLHRKVANQRANTLHHLTSRLAKTKSVVVIEDLNVAGMLKNHHLAQAIGDVGFYEFRRQLTYKAAWYGCQVIVVSRWEPTSKTCSHCGWVDEQLTLADRTFRCQACGLRAGSRSECGDQFSQHSPRVRRRVKTPVERMALARALRPW